MSAHDRVGRYCSVMACSMLASPNWHTAQGGPLCPTPLPSRPSASKWRLHEDVLAAGNDGPSRFGPVRTLC